MPKRGSGYFIKNYLVQNRKIALKAYSRGNINDIFEDNRYDITTFGNL